MLQVSQLHGFNVRQVYRANAVNFDGSNDYLTRGADLTGVSDGKSGIVSFWVKMNGGDGANASVVTNTSALGQSFYLIRASTNVFQVACGRAGSPSTLDLILNGSTSVVAATGWKHFLCSWDVAAATAAMYLNDVSDLAGGATITNNNLDYTGTGNFAIGAETDGGVKLNADLADVWVKFGSYLDLSVAANRRLFISSAGKPVYLGPTGTAPGLTPDVYLTGPLSDWHTNKGGGGGFTVNGALTESTTSPSG